MRRVLGTRSGERGKWCHCETSRAFRPSCAGRIHYGVFMEIYLSWLAVSAGAVAIYWLKLHYGRKNLLNPSPDLKALREQTDALHSDLQSVYDELADKIEQVNERMDFAERLLSQPGSTTEGPPVEETPEALTPV